MAGKVKGPREPSSTITLLNGHGNKLPSKFFFIPINWYISQPLKKEMNQIRLQLEGKRKPQSWQAAEVIFPGCEQRS